MNCTAGKYGGLSVVCFMLLLGVVSDSRAGTIIDKTQEESATPYQGKSWAIVVGIDAYKQNPPKYAVSDARAMAAFLETQGFQVTTLYDQQATRQAIMAEWVDRLSRRVGEHDRVLLYYAGHSDSREFRKGRRMGYLVPVDAEPDVLAATGISVVTLKEISDLLPAKHVLFLIDACAAGVPGVMTRGLPALQEASYQSLVRESGRQLLAACGGDAAGAKEDDALKGGVFTHFVIQGLSEGLADLNADGVIAASELYQYLDTQMFAATKAKGGEQRPEYWRLSADQGEFVFIPPKQPVGQPVGSDTKR